jgi:exopolysaccharide biosynthesis protein
VIRVTAIAAALLLAIASAPGSHGDAPLSIAKATWRTSSTGVERTAFEVAAGGEGWRTLVVAVRIDPAKVRFRLRARLAETRPAWTVDRAPAQAVLALNAGQFSALTPWGWVVMEGREIRPPGSGPLSTAVAWDTAGRVQWLDAAAIARHRRTGDVAEAFQSYPTLLDERGDVPTPIRRAGLGVDVGHRDARLAIGTVADGRLLVAITRFYGLGPLSPPVPLGLTLEEMARVMRELGCRRAVSLDGGVSAQLLLREDHRTLVWRGWRPVPLGLIAEHKER